jgi:divalent metal cation (Fe/Co/Zn/Cd) transporter
VSENPIAELSDEQLSFEVRAAFGAGGGAAMEAIRRLSIRMDAASNSHAQYAQSMRRLNATLMVLGMTLVVLTMVQIAMAWPNLDPLGHSVS